VALFIEGKPFRTVLRWQVYATVVSALIAAIWDGVHGAYSALLGGAINMTAGALFAWIAARSNRRTAGESLRTLFRAEAAKVALIIVQMWLVLTQYKQIVHLAFFASFILTVIVFSMAAFVRDQNSNTNSPAQ
jgi:ATP synthase protein I